MEERILKAQKQAVNLCKKYIANVNICLMSKTLSKYACYTINNHKMANYRIDPK